MYKVLENLIELKVDPITIGTTGGSTIYGKPVTVDGNSGILTVINARAKYYIKVVDISWIEVK